jgi:crossover junction endodeoxyribonuclease RusA
VKIVLPWPDRRLLPNFKRRSHWRAYQPVAKTAKTLAWAETIAQLLPEQRKALVAGEGPIAVRIAFYPPDRRRRDDDGMVGSFKHARDGIADALGIDDSRFKPHYFFEERGAPGRVEVEFIHRVDAPSDTGLNRRHPVAGLSPDEQEAA